MAQYISIPTQIVGQPNILFNKDNITAVIPPSTETVSLAAGAGSTTTITVTSTTGLVAGMAVTVTAGTGVFAPGTIVSSVTNSTTFVVSTAPTTTLSGATIVATTPYSTLWMQSKAFRLTFSGTTSAVQNANAIAASKIITNAVTSGNPSPICSNVDLNATLVTNGVGATGQTTITVNSTAGLSVGMTVTVVGGAGAFALNTTIASITNGTQFVVSAAPTTTLAAATISAAALTVTTLTVV
jgi:hypothetical protein